MNLRRAALLVFVVVIGGVAFLLLPLRQWFAQFELYVRSLGALGPFLFAFAYMLLTVVLFPASVLTIGAGTLFGLKTGFFTALLGANLGALCSFLLARSFLRQRVALWTAAHPKFRFLDTAIAKQGFKIVLLCRLSPIFPFILLNYFLGLTSVRTGAYILGNLLGMVPANFVFVYIGATAHDAVAGPAESSLGLYQQIMKYVGLLATVAAFAVMTRIARRALREAERAEEGGGFIGRPRSNEQPLKISVVIPTLNEAGTIATTLKALLTLAPHEIIIVDGGSSDSTRAICEQFGVKVLTSEPGRARQMNCGASMASGDLLLFLHADTKLPASAVADITAALRDADCPGGRFDVELDGTHWMLKIIGALINYRSRLTKIATGDQALFVRRAVFESMGGFSDIPLMEDIAFCRRLKRIGPIACLRTRVITSGRRWERDGVWRTIVKMWTLKLCYLAGASPERLKRYYADTR